MLDRVGENKIQDHLTALAGGELDAAQILAVLEYVDAHPEALSLMRDEQRVRLAVNRAVRALTPPVPNALRQAVASTPTIAPTGPARRGNWRWPLVAAVMLAAGLLIGRMGAPSNPVGPIVHLPIETDIPVPAEVVAYASRTHAACSRLERGLHAADYPQAVSNLAGLVRADLQSGTSHPDLTRIGYDFVGAGPCASPLQGTVHLLYHRRGGEPRRTISLFVQANSNQYALNPDTLYLLSGPRSPFPVYAWRTNAVVYFLIADDDAAADLARQQIAIAPPAKPISPLPPR